MSTDVNAQEPIETQAYDHLMAQVYQPVFFNKLAQYGVVPQNQAEASKLLRIGAGLFAQHQQKLAAVAEEHGTFLDWALSRLEGQSATNSYSDGQVKQAAVTVLNDQVTMTAAVILAGALRKSA